MTIKQVAASLIKRLKAEGFIIQRYDAYSTNSIYLKLDYGVCNSIRISDHRGKKHLSYRYNVEQGRKEIQYIMDQGKYPRYYYGFAHLDALLTDILSDRKYKQQLYGEEQYKAYMQRNIADGAKKKGFWQSAVEV